MHNSPAGKKGVRGVREQNAYPVLLVRDASYRRGFCRNATRTSQPPSPPIIPNPFKTLCYSCLDIVKPHFQHRHYVKHVAKADKSNNGALGASTRRDGRKRVKDFPIAHPGGRSRRPFDRSTDLLPPFAASRFDLSCRARTSSSAANSRNLAAELVP